MEGNQKERREGFLHAGGVFALAVRLTKPEIVQLSLERRKAVVSVVFGKDLI